MKPEFSKPFDIKAAQAGAPYCCADGAKATVLKWDLRGSGPLTGFVESANGEDLVTRWNEQGITFGVAARHGDLIMTQLGMVDGKPVFVGDEIEDGGDGDWTRGVAYPQNRDFKNCRWPAPVPAYPTTTMGHSELAAAYMGADKEQSSWHSGCAKSLANAALRHACETQQVVPMEQVQEVARGLAEKARAERDMAIARAVDAVYCTLVAHKQRNSDNYLASIIAKVPA